MPCGPQVESNTLTAQYIHAVDDVNGDMKVPPQWFKDQGRERFGETLFADYNEMGRTTEELLASKRMNDVRLTLAPIELLWAARPFGRQRCNLALLRFSWWHSRLLRCLPCSTTRLKSAPTRTRC